MVMEGSIRRPWEALCSYVGQLVVRVDIDRFGLFMNIRLVVGVVDVGCNVSNLGIGVG